MFNIIKNIVLFNVVCLLLNTTLFSQTGEWKELFPKNSPPPRAAYGMAYLGDDKVMIFGGSTVVDKKTVILNDTWVYDLSENTWTEIITDIKPSARYLHVMSRLGNNKVLLFGGDLKDDSFAGDTWVFDYDSLTWTELHFTKKPRYRDRAASSYIGNNSVILNGGMPGPSGYYNDSWVFNLFKNQWDSVTTAYPFPTPCGLVGREGAQMCEIDDHRVLLFGGWDGCNLLSDNWIFDRNLGDWNYLIPQANTFGRGSGGMAFLTENKILLFGGNSAYDTTNPEAAAFSNETWILDAKYETWTKLTLDVKPLGRRFHRLDYIGDGKVILFSGETEHGMDDGADTWLFEYKPTDVKEMLIDSTLKINILSNTQNGVTIKIDNLNLEKIKIDLYDMKGNYLKTLWDDLLNSNKLELNLDCKMIECGIYFLKFSSSIFIKSEKILIVK